MVPSKQVRDVYTDLAIQVDKELAKLKVVKEKDVPAFNELVRQKALPVINARIM
jgi:hypothetical protein